MIVLLSSWIPSLSACFIGRTCPAFGPFALWPWPRFWLLILLLFALDLINQWGFYMAGSPKCSDWSQNTSLWTRSWQTYNNSRRMPIPRSTSLLVSSRRGSLLQPLFYWPFCNSQMPPWRITVKILIGIALSWCNVGSRCLPPIRIECTSSSFSCWVELSLKDNYVHIRAWS